MRKTTAILLGGSLLFLSWCTIGQTREELAKDPTEQTETKTGQVIQYVKNQPKEEKIQEAKKRKNFKSFIRKGDYFFAKDDKEKALNQYLRVYSRLKTDQVLEKKIARTYYSMYNYEKAYDFFRRVPVGDLTEAERAEMFQSLMFADPFENRRLEIQKIPWIQEEMEYYDHIDTCYTGIHNCVVALQKNTSTGTKLAALRSTVTDYVKVTPDFQYRNALLAAELYKQKQYLAAAKISDEIVSKRPNYKSVIKICGYAWFEIGNWEKAKDCLLKYYSYEGKDVQTAYRLGISFFELGDYESSNMYFNVAVVNWFEPKGDIERRLAYNYFLLKDANGMNKVFRYILEGKDVTEEDFEIAVYSAIENGEISKASNWSDKAIKRFPKSAWLWALHGWVLRLKEETYDANNVLEEVLRNDPTNPLALLQMGGVYQDTGDFITAKKYYAQVMELDPEWEFGWEAQTKNTEIEELEAKMKAMDAIWTGSENTGSTEERTNLTPYQ